MGLISLQLSLYWLIGQQLFLINSKCPDGNFECKSGSQCIDVLKTCDGFNDCRDASDEALNCPKGCDVNGTLVATNTTVQTPEWWYRCSRSRWILSGCVVNDRRSAINETFLAFTPGGVYWGKCDQVKPGVILRQPQGCVSVHGQQFTNGQKFLLNSAFWATCNVTQNSTVVHNEKLSLNDISWQIIGCNNGSNTPVKDGEIFPWFFEPSTLWGLKLTCKIPKKPKVMPILNPVQCIVGVNLTKGWEIRVLKSKCYMAVDDLLFFCEIVDQKIRPKSALPNESRLDQAARFNLNVTDNSANEVQRLKSTGFSACYDVDALLTSLANKRPKLY